MVEWIASYMERVADLPVRANVQPGDILAQLPPHPPERAHESWDAIFDDLDRVIMPGLTHWQSPGFFAYFPCNASGPGILGEMVSAALNVNGMLWATSPAATELEIRMLDWAAEALALPAAFLSTSERGGGCIQGTASESTLLSLLAARRRVIARGGDPDRLTAYASRESHSSVVKAAMIAGLARDADDRSRLRLIDTDENFAMRPNALRDAMRRDADAGLAPAWVCATLGTTSSHAFDPLAEIGAIARKHGAWLHVDAAHAGVACVCPEFRWMLEGVEHADSFCTNPHKRLLTNFDCDLFWTRDRRSLIEALSVNPAYLATRESQAGAVDFRDWQVPLGRRFRALKLWFVFRHYGLEGLREHVRDGVRLAALFESLVRDDGRLEVVTPRRLDLVCFAPRSTADAKEDSRRCAAILDHVHATGRALLTQTTLSFGLSRSPRPVLRLAVGAPGADDARIVETWNLIRAAADRAIPA